MVGDLWDALADRFLLERELGRGGMAVVYLAQDLKHKRHVALKVLRDDLSAVLGADRFHREIEIAAGLQHPHILPLYDSGEAAGTLYYVMPYVEGESLRARLAREGPLSIEDSLRISLETADALAYAHSCGIIHRDIKPENILLSGNHAVVADFGIARAISNAGMQTLTAVGFILGTPAYMAPEQASGEEVVDARADIYALGCVLYECLTGKPPFSGGSPQAILARQITEAPVDVSATRTGVPEPVRVVLRRALMKSPGARYQTSGEFAEALSPASRRPSRGAGRTALGGWRRPRTVVAGAAVVALALAAGAVALARHSSTAEAPPTDRIRSIAVLPLRNLSSDPENEYFSEGMTEELIAALTRVDGLRVAPRSSSFAFKDKNRSSSDVGRELRVDAVIDGSVQRSGGQLQLQAQLVRVANDSVIWTEKYRRQLADVFTLQDELSSAILARLRPTLSGSVAAAATRHATRDTEAYDLYLQGRFYLARRERDGLLKATDYFQRAVAKDSTFSDAYAGLANALGLLPPYGDIPPLELAPRARAAAERALALDSSSAEAHTSLGFNALFLDQNWPTAQRELDRAVALDSTSATIPLFRAWLALIQGRPDQALAEIRRAQQLEPRSLIVNTRVGSMLYYTRQYDAAVAQLQQTISLDPTYELAHAELARVYAMQGRPVEQVRAEYLKAPTFATRYEGLGLGYALGASGDTAQAARVRDALLARAKQRYVDAPSLAVVYAGLGDTPHAVAWLEKAVADHAWSVGLLEVEPMWDRLRPDPRFKKLVQRLRIG